MNIPASRPASQLPSERTLSILSGKQKFDVGYLLDRTYARPDDVVIVAGTLIEGIGTQFSDFDVYVIGQERPRLKDVDVSKHHWIYNSEDNITTGRDGELLQLFDYVDPGAFAWDVEYWTENEVVRLLNQTRQNYIDALKHTRNVFSLSYKTSGFLHRLFGAVPLQGKARFSALLSGLSREELCFLGFRQYAGGYPVFRDIKGSWSDGDLSTAHQIAMTFLSDQIFALTFLALDSNPNRKWLFKKLERLPADYQQLAERYRELYFGGARTEREKARNILDAMDLIDSIFAAFRRLLRSNPAFFDPDTALCLIDEEQRSRSITHDELANQFLFRRKIFTDGLPSCAELLGKTHAAAQ